MKNKDKFIQQEISKLELKINNYRNTLRFPILNSDYWLDCVRYNQLKSQIKTNLCDTN